MEKIEVAFDIAQTIYGFSYRVGRVITYSGDLESLLVLENNELIKISRTDTIVLSNVEELELIEWVTLGEKHKVYATSPITALNALLQLARNSVSPVNQNFIVYSSKVGIDNNSIEFKLTSTYGNHVTTYEGKLVKTNQTVKGQWIK